MISDETLLDRPVWNSLNSGLAHLAEGDERARRFPPEIGPFVAASPDNPEAASLVAQLMMSGEAVSLLEVSPPSPPNGLEATEVPCVQLVQRDLPEVGARRDIDIAPLDDDDAEEMLALATLTQPGPFAARTHTLGPFVGVRIDGRLAAMGGERMFVNSWREISGVCTHPDFQGRGLGRALLQHIAQSIRARRLTPFLHSRADNAVAIRLYESLGFRIRAELMHSVWRQTG